MAVPLLPFQKIVDIPETALRYRHEICKLASTSIVLASLILIMAFISTAVSGWSPAMGILFLCVIPLETLFLFILVLATSIVAICNTDKWAPADKCCNLMRSYPACCTKCYGGNKHCFARLSSFYIMASVYAGLSSLIAGLALIAGCIASSVHYNDSDAKHSDYYSSYSADYYTRRSLSSAQSFRIQLFTYQVSSLVLLLCLVVISARLAWSIRQIENNQPDIAVLPPTKMVTLHAVDNMSVGQSIIVSGTADVEDEKTNTELRTEQNV